MNRVKLRQNLVLLHLFFAAFMAPAFLLVAISGGLYLTGNKGKVTSSPVELPRGTVLDFNSPDLETHVRKLFKSAGIDEDFEYIKNRGTLIQTRPTSQNYIEIKQGEGGLQATHNIPDFQKSMMELHKGHGPTAFKTYQKLVALALMAVVFGGFFVGLLAANYRRKTLIASGLGVIVFLLLALA